MNTLDMPMNYVPALEEQGAMGKDLESDALPFDLIELIDECSTEWAKNGEDFLEALGGASFEEALNEGVKLLESGGLLEDVYDLVNADFAAEAEATAAKPVADAEAAEEPAKDAAAEPADPATPRKDFDPFFNHPYLSPFSMRSLRCAERAGYNPGPDMWAKFEFPDCGVEEGPYTDLYEYSRKFENGIPKIDWEAEMDCYFEPKEEKQQKRKPAKEVMWSPAYELVHRPKPMLTPAQLRRKLEEDMQTSVSSDAATVAVTPDNSLLLANRSTTVPAASAMKSRPMRSLLNTKQQQHVVKTSSRSLLLPTARTKPQAAGAAPSHTVVKQKPSATVTCDPVPPAQTSVEIKASRSEPEPVKTSSRPETPQSITESEDEAPVFRHNTIDTIFSSTLCDGPSSTVYLTPSDSSGSPKSAFCDEDYEDEELEEEEEEEEEEDYELQNLKSPPESVIREERPARTVLPYISDHSYHLSKSNVRIDGLGVQTPSDSEEEIDVVSVEGKGTARLPNNPSARDRRQLQLKVATAISRQSRHAAHQSATEAAAAGEAPQVSRKRRASSSAGRGPAKRQHLMRAPLGLGRGKGKAFGRGRRRANADEEPDPCEKRSMHNSMERQRRIDLRNLVERLRQLVPATMDNKRAAKVVILREAAKYCLELGVRQVAQERERARLLEEQAFKKKLLSILRKELANARRREESKPRFGPDYFTAEEIKPEPVEMEMEMEEEYVY